jgi:hypothetical protein
MGCFDVKMTAETCESLQMWISHACVGQGSCDAVFCFLHLLCENYKQDMQKFLLAQIKLKS